MSSRPNPERRPSERGGQRPPQRNGQRPNGSRPGGSRPNGNRNSARRQARRRRNKIILFVVEILVLVTLLAVLYVVLKGEKTERIVIKEENVEINETVKENATMKGYRNVALFGVDSRNGSLGKGNRSDTIMIASINMDTGDVKLVSVYRDTYLNLGNDTYNKCNSAYAKGGPEQAIIMLNKNLDMNITDYVTVGFEGLTSVIDALGGVEIDVTEAEIEHLNNYQISMVGTTKDNIHFEATAGVDYTPVTQPGLQTLNGLQATAFCRIRYIGDDFARTQRQQEVIQAIAAKAKQASPAKLNSTADAVMSNISTSFELSEIVELLGDITKYSIVATDGFPFADSRTTGNVGAKGSCVIPLDLKTNVQKLHAFLFNAQDYQVSPEVEACSSKVASDTKAYAK